MTVGRISIGCIRFFALLRMTKGLNLLRHQFQNFPPVIYPLVVGVVYIMKSVKHNGLPFKIVEVFNMVINHVVGTDNAFIATKNNIAPADEREMLA